MAILDRWDIEAIDELPNYSRIVLRLILETIGEIEREMKPRGRSASVQHTIDEVINRPKHIHKCCEKSNYF